MNNSILREDLFPIACVHCKKQYDVEAFIEAIDLTGLVYADCGDIIFQGITCTDEKCNKTNLWQFPRTNPLVDLRDFIIAPNFVDVRTNIIEQVIERERDEHDNDFLRFSDNIETLVLRTRSEFSGFAI